MRPASLLAAVLAVPILPTLLAAQAAAPAPDAATLAQNAVDASAANTVAINFVWTLVTGFLVMFMQAGFALVETGFTRAKNAGHTMAMNFMVYPIGMLGYWAVGFAIQVGGVGTLGGLGSFSAAHLASVSIGGHDLGLFGTKGFFLTGVAYTAPVFACSCSRWCSWTPTATIPTGALAERWKFSSFMLFTASSSAPDHVSDLRQLGLGRRLAVAARHQLRPRPRPRGLRRLLGGAHARRRHRARPAHG